MAKKEDIFQGLVTIIIGQLGNVSKDKIVPEANFLNDLGAGSLDVVIIVMEAEKVFEAEIFDSEKVGKIDTVSDLVDLIIKKTSTKLLQPSRSAYEIFANKFVSAPE